MGQNITADELPSKADWLSNDVPDLPDGYEEILVVRYYCGSLHIEFGDLITGAGSWGMMLADIARVMAPVLAEFYGMSEQAFFETMVETFVSGGTWLAPTARQLSVADIARKAFTPTS